MDTVQFPENIHYTDDYTFFVMVRPLDYANDNVFIVEVDIFNTVLSSALYFLAASSGNISKSVFLSINLGMKPLYIGQKSGKRKDFRFFGYKLPLHECAD